MRDGVDAGRSGNVRRQAERQRRIIQHRLRQHLPVAPGFLATIFRQSVNRRHFRPGVRRRHGDDRRAGLERDRFREPDCRAAANGHAAIGVEALRRLARRAHDLDGHVHRGLGIHAGGRAAQ